MSTVGRLGMDRIAKVIEGTDACDYPEMMREALNL